MKSTNTFNQPPPFFSIIILTYNSSKTLPLSLNSLFIQTFGNYEVIVVDAFSTDNSLELVKTFGFKKTKIFQKKPNGIYNALNYAINHCEGKYIGLLHSDDELFDETVLHDIHQTLVSLNADLIYGNIQYVSLYDPLKIVRNWKSSAFKPSYLNIGWMPPHVSIFVKREVIESDLKYDEKYQISADYDWIIKAFRSNKIKKIFLNRYISKMKVGGESNRSLKNIFKKMKEDIQIMKSHKINPFFAFPYKNISKIKQFFF